MRIAVVEKDRCQPKKCNYECVNFCPVVRQGQTDCIAGTGPGGRAVISEKLCIGCGICVHKCPFDAIHIINLPEALGTDLIQQYGENGFRLFRLPVPRKGAIVGLLGPNGIGKTTAIRILSGQEVPNAGLWGDPARWDALLERYRGTELGDYLKRVASGELRTALKPQYVDTLPRIVKGKVRDLLEKVDERGALADIVRRLDVARVLDQPLDTLSGGELQRVAIAATAARKADVYFFDEPSSFLDIRERLAVARLIRELTADAAVVVIEHDLAVLDFLAETTHLFYGTEAAFGVVALPRPVRTGINTYLDGHLREENIRFRNESIRFEVRPPRKEWQAGTLLEFPALEKRLDGFHVAVDGGRIRMGEVVGVVGPNATGKTTFVKMLSKDVAPDRGSVTTTARIAYKPQYIKTDFSGTVQEFLYQEGGAAADSGQFKAEVSRPLSLERLVHKEVPKLSGGELQRVFVALTLAREADLYLLDEPSAYLDSDQRIIVAKTLRRAMEKRGSSALVVDHDVYFLDLVADSLMVFEGTPGKEGRGHGPFEMEDGMNRFLANVEITFRRDKDTLRPRVNKEGSALDREQKAAGRYYYNVPGD